MEQLGQDVNYKKSRYWCFTNKIISLDDIKIPEERIEYIVIGQEIGVFGMQYLQGYVVTYDVIDLDQMRKWLPRAHLEIMRGTSLEASNYCKKQGNIIIERGQLL